MQWLIIFFILTSCGNIELIKVPVISRTDHEKEKEKEIQTEITNKKKEQARSKTFKNTKKVSTYFELINKTFEKYGWEKVNVNDQYWHHVRSSYLGRPLIWTVFGNEKEHKIKRKDMTLILCGVHGDEITPIKFCFDIIEDLRSNPGIIDDNRLVAIAPIVTPDSFFKKRPTRFNARGVDINRNFPTRDWKKKALKTWKKRYGSDKRRYPGKKPNSEQETIFQVNLIARYTPSKIISVHAPLTMLDYDGPSFDGKASTPRSVSAMQLLIHMSQKASGYTISNYPYFPGSLGNYAGNERNIPTYTLELPTTDYTKSAKYWELFREAIHHAVNHDLRQHHKVVLSDEEN